MVYMKTVVITCGGTGGHLAPGIAVAQELSLRGYRCILLMSRKQVDKRLAQGYRGLTFVAVPGIGLSWMNFPLFLWHQLGALLVNIHVMYKYKPIGCIAFGGFLTLGTFLASRIFRLPFALHEANHVPGRVVRLLQRFADRIYLPEGVTLPHARKDRMRYKGYPVRSDVSLSKPHSARSALGLEIDRPVLLVLGGSQGAAALTRWTQKNAQALALEGVQVYCLMGMQGGPERMETHKDAQGNPIKAYYVPFSDVMGIVLAAADVVVSRAGAGSIAEINFFKKPTVYVPYPYACDDHQAANVRYLQHQDAGVRVPESELNRLLPAVLGLLKDAPFQEILKKGMARLAKKNDVKPLVDDFLSLVD